MQKSNNQEKKRVSFNSQYLACPLRPYVCRVQGDLQQEISYLQAKVFPHLDSLCLARGTRFLPVDLQQSQDEGAVTENGLADDHNFQTAHRPAVLLDQRLKISLDLIDRSCFFICLLGHRYGNVLQEENGSTSDIGPCSLSEVARNLHVAEKAGFSWVLEDKCRSCSLTELEIMKAAFHDQHRSCFFYFKDYTPPDNTDIIGNDTLVVQNALSTESHSERERVRNLKRRIIGHCLPVRFFRNMRELGMMMKKDWEGVISQFYGDPELPVAGRQDLFDLRYHESHARALCDWFMPSTQATEIMNVINTFVYPITHNTKSETHSRDPGTSITGDPTNKGSEKSVLLVSGERGCGKSTLAAWWLQTFCKQNPSVPVICHFCGTSMSSTDVRSLLRQRTAELRRVHYGRLTDWDHILEDGVEPLHRMVQTFSAAASLGPCVILIDGIDLLTETFGLSVQEVKELRWLPEALPPHCKLIITTTFTDLTYKNLTTRTDAQIIISPGLSDPRVHRSILLKHLSLPGKELPTGFVQRIVGKKLCRLPAFLALLGTELRSCGIQREEDLELLEEYMEVDSVPELWMKVILHWVKVYSRSAPTEAISKATTANVISFREDLSGWVWDTLCLIHVSRDGLTEVEVLTLLEDLGYCGNLKIELLEWARLRSAFWPWVQEKANGRLTIMHQSFSQAMNLLLIGSKAQVRSQKDFHQILADFFQKSSLCSWVRKMEEVPRCLMHTGSFRKLHHFLSNPATVEALSDSLEQYPQLKTDVMHYWALLREEGFDPASSFHNLMPQGHDDVYSPNHSRTCRLSVFGSKVLLGFGESHQAEKLLIQADQISQKGEHLDRDVLCVRLKVQHMLANLYVRMHLMKDAEMYCRKGLETAQHLTAHPDSTEIKLITGQLLCRLCLILLEDRRLYEVPGFLKEISSARYASVHPSSEGTVLLLKAIHKLSLNEPKAAERCLQTALASRRRWYGPDHRLVGEVEEQLADLWSSTQSHTDWAQRKIIELYRHVLGTKETEAQASPFADLQRDLAVVLEKFGLVLLRGCSKAERREGLDLLQRASDIRIHLLGHDQPLTRELENVSNTDIGRKQSLSRSPSASHPCLYKEQHTRLQASISKCHVTGPSCSKERPSPENRDRSRAETLNRPRTTLQLSVFGPQSDITTLLPTGKAGWQTSVPRSARRAFPGRRLSTSAK